MNVIFLDIDGVLNSNNWFRHQTKMFGKAFIETFSPESVDAMNYIIELTTSKIVISSSWRIHTEKEELQKHFNEQGMKCEIIGTTPFLKKERGIEIQAWLDDSELDIGNFVIIDDINDMINLEKRLVLVNSNTGFTKDYFDQVIKILKL